jgi:hypothetical protein
MKTKIILLAALFTLQISALFAGSDMVTLSGSAIPPTVNVKALAPVPPQEATFEDVAASVPSVSELAPSAPAEADFEEVADEETLFGLLAPVTPVEADFE